MLEQLKQVDADTFAKTLRRMPKRIKRRAEQTGTSWHDCNRTVAKTNMNQCYVLPQFAKAVCKVEIKQS